MHRLFRFFLILLAIAVYGPVKNGYSQDRRPSYPYVTGDGFRSACDFIYDETNKKMDPAKVVKGNKIFVKTDYLNEFFSKIHPKITQPYILITHNSDHPVPAVYAAMLDDEKLLAWFGQNTEGYTHPKLISIPIGLENRYNSHGNPSFISQGMKKIKRSAKEILLYMNFSQATYPREREPLYKMFKQVSYCLHSSPKNYMDYLSDLSRCKFVLSPRGNGLDTHRAWESLYMGAIPIVKTSAMDSIFEGLPVLIIREWETVNEEFLEQKYNEMTKGSYSMEKLQMQYWIELIQSVADKNLRN